MTERTTRPRHRFGTLLVALMVLFVGFGLLDYTQQFLPSQVVIGTSILLLIWVLIAAVLNVSGRKRSTEIRVLRGLVIATILVLLVAAVLDNHETILIGRALAFLCIGCTIFVVLRFLIHVRQVDTDTIYASICVYLLMSIAWALLYSLIHFLEPGAFSEGHDLNTFGQRAMQGELYYSLVTITTLGYGDVTPLSTAARMAAALEAVIGQIYIVVLVAKLVGLHATQSVAEDE